VKARGLVREFLDTAPSGPGAPAYFVRVQPVASGMILRDLQAVMGPNLAGVLLPKITGPADVHAADAIIGCIETELGLPVGQTMLYPILENARAIRNAYEIATASQRVAYMGGAVSRFGDIAGDIGFRWTRRGTETLFIREKVLIDARAAGIRYPISGMWGGANDDLDGLQAWLSELRDIGYFGMMLGNKDHVAIANAAFTPTVEEIAYWQDLDRLATTAERDNERVVYGDVNQGEGHEIHIAHVATARRLLTWATELGVA
jgi:citrate lyase subunit beta/citryl-CoA lyase